MDVLDIRDEMREDDSTEGEIVDMRTGGEMAYGVWELGTVL